MVQVCRNWLTVSGGTDAQGAGVGVRVGTGGVGVSGQAGGVFHVDGGSNGSGQARGVFHMDGGSNGSGSDVGGGGDVGGGSNVGSAGVGVTVTESGQELLIGFLVGDFFFGNSDGGDGQQNNELRSE